MKNNLTKNRSLYATEETFSDEFNFLKKFNPYALEDKCNTIDKLLPENFLKILVGEKETLLPLYSYKSLNIRPLDSKFLLDVKNYDFFELYNELKLIGGERWADPVAEEMVVNLGTDAFGMYLPFHNYHNCHWGIFLFPEIIYQHALRLYDHFGPSGYEKKEILIMYFFAVYRSLLFHYQTERYATKLELITHQSHYKMLGRINEEVRNSEDWLQVALASATVLDSILVSNRSKMNIVRIREIYEYDLKRMPAGYRHYKCEKYGNYHKAQEHFASQIKEMKVFPGFKLPELFTVKGEFGSNDLSVPLYFVTGFNEIVRMR